MYNIGIPDELNELYNKQRLIPFVGAGVSMSLTWMQGTEIRRGPSWKELVDEAARDLGFELPDLLRVRGTDLQILEYYRIKKGSFARLNYWLSDRMKPLNDDLKRSVIHQELVALEKCNCIYTTNFDDLIERSFDALGRKAKVVVKEAHVPGSPAECQIIKFHGDLNHPEEMVMSESDYERRLSFSTILDFRFRSDILNKAVLFIGYSFRDSNVSYLFSLVDKLLDKLPESRSGRRAYIIVPDPSDFERRLFNVRNIEVIPINTVSMTDDIAKILTLIRG